MDFNKVVLVGRVTRDPETRNFQSGGKVCKIGFVTNRKWKDKDSGENREKAMFIDVKFFGKMADTVQQYITKGKELLIEGELELETWEQDGQKRSKHVINGNNFRFGSDGKGEGRSEESRPPARATAPATAGDGDLADNDDIPF